MPAGHFEQIADAGPLKYPALHARQLAGVDAPMDGLLVPAEQFVQDESELRLNDEPYVPRGHEIARPEGQ